MAVHPSNFAGNELQELLGVNLAIREKVTVVRRAPVYVRGEKRDTKNQRPKTAHREECAAPLCRLFLSDPPLTTRTPGPDPHHRPL